MDIVVGDRVSLLVQPNSRNRLRRARFGTVTETGGRGVRVTFDDEPGEVPDRWLDPAFLLVTARKVFCYDDPEDWAG